MLMNCMVSWLRPYLLVSVDMLVIIQIFILLIYDQNNHNIIHVHIVSQSACLKGMVEYKKDGIIRSYADLSEYGESKIKNLLEFYL